MKRIGPLFLLLFAFGCSRAPIQNGAQDTETTLMPLDIGTAWTYDLSYVEDGQPIEASMTLTVDRTASLGPYRFFHVQTRLRQDTTTVDPGTDLLMRHTEAGMQWLTFDYGERTDSLLFRYPVAEGASFPLGQVGLENVTAFVETGRVTVPAGTFEAVRYQFIAAGDEIEYAFAPGVGLLRVIYDAVDPDYDSAFVLRRYEAP